MLANEIEEKYAHMLNGAPDHTDPPRGEMRSNLPVRARYWADESQIAEEGGDVVLVGHGGSMKGLITAFLDLPDSAMDTLVIDNCSITVLSLNPNPNTPNQLVALNHTAHLV